GWDVCDGSGVDDDGVGGDRHGVGAAGDADCAFAGELGATVDQQHRVEVGEHRVVLLPHCTGQGVAAFDGLGEVFGGVVIGGFVLGVVDEDLRGDAGDVDAGAADHHLRLFDEGDLLAGAGHGPGQSLAAFAPADDEEV